MIPSWRVTAFVLVGLLTTAVAEASPAEVLGFGYRAIGMGRASVAAGRGVDTIYGNPALLSLARERELQLGVQGALFDLQAEGQLPTSAGKISYSPLRANTIGLVLPLPFEGALKDRVVLGLGFLTPFDVVVRGRILYPETPQFLVADRVQSVAIQGALGVDIAYGLRLGGGVAALAALDGSVLVATDASGRIGTRVEDTLVASYAPLLGASYDLSDAYRVGLAFRGELVARFNVVITAEDLGGIVIPPLNISGVAQYDPWQLALELARVQGAWKLGIGATYKHWPAYPGPVEATVRCSDAPEPDAECAAPQPPVPEYSPIVAPHVGAERSFQLFQGAALALRAGYGFEPSAAPEQVARENYFDNHRSVFSLG